MTQTQKYTAAQFAAAATAASQDVTAATGTLELPRLEGRRYVRIYCKVTGGGTATIKLLVGHTSTVAVVADSGTTIGSTGDLLVSDLGPHGYVAVDWSSNGGTVVVEAVAFDAED